MSSGFVSAFCPLYLRARQPAAAGRLRRKVVTRRRDAGNPLTGMKLCSCLVTLPHNLKVKFALSDYTHHKQ